MKYNLSDICDYAKGKINVSVLDEDTYISTENMIPIKVESPERLLYRQ